MKLRSTTSLSATALVVLAGLLAIAVPVSLAFFFLSPRLSSVGESLYGLAFFFETLGAVLLMLEARRRRDMIYLTRNDAYDLVALVTRLDREWGVAPDGEEWQDDHKSPETKDSDSAPSPEEAIPWFAETLSRGEVLERIRELADALQRLGVAENPDRLRRRVRDLKRSLSSEELL
ncbi:MAG TPA: hypothetical protein VK215_06685 [Acidimicrobiales bacterium]|nr:hypothetical protein [Acidimicrobiales bacterium]HLN42120.1 hypothetical protein [Acidimicrobiales bacterium]